MSPIYVWLCGLLVLFALAGCGQTPTAALPQAVPTAAPTASAPTASASANPLVQRAQAALSAHLQLQPAQLSVQSAQQVEWPTSALGCPAAGKAYMQVITPGFEVVFSDATRSYEVHTTSDGSPLIWCNNGQPTLLVAGT